MSTDTQYLSARSIPANPVVAGFVPKVLLAAGVPNTPVLVPEDPNSPVPVWAAGVPNANTKHSV